MMDIDWEVLESGPADADRTVLLNGGMLATFADVASAASLWASCDRDIEIPVTTDMHVRYYRQPRSGPLKAEATVVHRGRRLLGTECVSSLTQRIESLFARLRRT